MPKYKTYVASQGPWTSPIRGLSTEKPPIEPEDVVRLADMSAFSAGFKTVVVNGTALNANTLNDTLTLLIQDGLKAVVNSATGTVTISLDKHAARHEPNGSDPVTFYFTD